MAFKNPAQQSMYTECRRLGNDAFSTFYSNGYINVLAGHRSAYFNGRRGEKARYLRTSFAYAAWRAGADDRKQDVKDGNILIPPWNGRPVKWSPGMKKEQHDSE